MDSVSKYEAGSDIRPPGMVTRPMCMSPLRNVPAVKTTHLHENSAPSSVFKPTTWPSFTSNSVTVSCQMFRLGWFSRTLRQAHMNLARSHCALGLHMAGPLERFSMRNCMAVLSVTRPMWPPSASISLTICPLAIPPTAGLQLICAILFISMVIRQVLEPICAAAAAASHPAWPAPITITSYLKSIQATNLLQNLGMEDNRGASLCI